MNPTLTKNYVAEGVINPYRIIKHGTADGQVLQSDAVADAMFGATGELGADAANDRIDVHVAGQVDIEFGGAVTRGDPITSDALGRAITAAPVAGVNNRIVGFAQVSGVAGDIAPVDLSIGRIQG